jgi:hypothetical protein
LLWLRIPTASVWLSRPRQIFQNYASITLLLRQIPMSFIFNLFITPSRVAGQFDFFMDPDQRV